MFIFVVDFSLENYTDVNTLYAYNEINNVIDCINQEK